MNLDPPRAGCVIQARALSRRFGDRLVLNELDLTVERSEFVCLVGRSGVGKTTLLRILGGIDEEFEGDVFISRRTSLMFQDARLLPWQRAITNVTLGLRGSGASVRGISALREVGLEARARAWPRELSGGELQRVAMARSVARGPEVLLLDEPFGALDAFTRARMQTMLKQLCSNHGCAGLLVTHDVDEAIEMGDRVVLLADGTLSLDVALAMPRPRHRGNPEFMAIRKLLLDSLGPSDAR